MPRPVPIVAFERYASVNASRCSYCRRRMGTKWVWQLTHPDGSNTYACGKCFEEKKK